MLKLFAPIFLISFVLGCKSTARDKLMTVEECKDASICKVFGSLDMKSDGHGFIGKLTLDDGTCVDVSLPEKQSSLLLGKSKIKMMIKGPVLPYPYNEDIFYFKVNGRKIGFGNCGEFYVFVRG